ncbi:MAG: SufS family cysteine desulfurase [Candidatus Neomarinimicrobiota bacterium]|nr:SufS family cysteine desulfurase [Candidatus Neomarinimicrobiota bacterium]|tara:strand:+ start:1834 stop:3039 length:1206 start_codon:yes stop_codon:yes gene_type:complete
MLTVDDIRKEFPIFSQRKGLVYLDSASTAQKPQSVIDSVSSYYSNYNANIHRALYEIGEKATNEYEAVREKVREFINVPDTHEIIFTRSSTESINLVAHAWGNKNLSDEKGVLISEMEHHSNLVPWQLITKKVSSFLNYISLLDDGTLDLSSIEKKMHQIGLIAITHQSNVFGTINPISNIVNLAKSKGIVSLIDGAQAAPHFPVNLNEIDCDFYVFSSHKMVGPTGAGVLIGRRSLLEEMDPFLSGGEMINNVTLNESTWNDVPWKFEAGTPNIAQVIGLGAAIDFLAEVGLDKIQQHEEQLLHYGLEELSKIEGIVIYGNPPERGAVIPFNVKNIHPHDLAKFLDTDKICIRAGHHCAQPIMNKLGISASARASFYLYNDTNDIDQLIQSIKKTANIFV